MLFTFLQIIATFHYTIAYARALTEHEAMELHKKYLYPVPNNANLFGSRVHYPPGRVSYCYKFKDHELQVTQTTFSSTS